MLVSIRLDQFPNSIGTISSKLKSYDTIRAFFTSSTIYILVDIPFAIVYIFIISIISSPLISGVIVFSFILAFIIGIILKYKIEKKAILNAKYTNKRVGELVESIQSLEIIKSNSAEKKFLDRWIKTNIKSIENEMQMRNINENSLYISMFFQSFTYVSVVIIGALTIIDSEMTMGALIATSIIGSRVMSPLSNLPNFLVQYTHTKAALSGLEEIYSLQRDNSDIEVPLKPEKLFGTYNLIDIEYDYQDSIKVLKIDKLVINKGDKIAVMGAIGSGKSTLLKILSGLYKPTTGRVLLDNLDLSHIAPEYLYKKIGYLTQDSRLFEGTLKENILLNNAKDISDDTLNEIASKTGLSHILKSQPKGYELPIYEGGVGLSQGQKQIVSITRLLLNKPNIWILDEPTASMDSMLETHIINLLKNSICEEDTLILSTHNPALLKLVDKIIILNNSEIALFDKKDIVLAKLRKQ
jgi:ATP-binding cassette subfamily C protein LapB